MKTNMVTKIIFVGSLIVGSLSYADVNGADVNMVPPSSKGGANLTTTGAGNPEAKDSNDCDCNKHQGPKYAEPSQLKHPGQGAKPAPKENGGAH